MPTEMIVAGVVMALGGMALMIAAFRAPSKRLRGILAAVAVVLAVPGAYVMLGLLVGYLNGEFG